LWDERISIGQCRQCGEKIFADDETCYEVPEAGVLYCADCCGSREPGDIYIEQLESEYGDECDRRYEEWVDSQMFGGDE